MLNNALKTIKGSEEIGESSVLVHHSSFCRLPQQFLFLYSRVEGGTVRVTVHMNDMLSNQFFNRAFF